MERSKADQLLDELRSGWCEAPALARKFGWRPHTLRGAISKLAKMHNLRVERRRENGVNHYRVDDSPGLSQRGG
ncbi:DUF3489 domain-containing protein [Bradyrhizobium sp. WSM2254]|uniref:DUF3489 domain-containing protein n=1 Tax=Bradyrhizobium sp. WSM2254 TaxID=1188263 RepID=UPI000A068BDA